MNTKIKPLKIAIVAATFNQTIVEGLLRGAINALELHGISDENVTRYHVPGAFEIPLICQDVAKRKMVDGIISLGAVIRGETAHFDYIAGECARGISVVSLNENIPISFGVLATNTLEQALARSADDPHNKGDEAASALIDMITLRKKIWGETLTRSNNHVRA